MEQIAMKIAEQWGLLPEYMATRLLLQCPSSQGLTRAEIFPLPHASRPLPIRPHSTSHRDDFFRRKLRLYGRSLCLYGRSLRL